MYYLETAVSVAQPFLHGANMPQYEERQQLEGKRTGRTVGRKRGMETFHLRIVPWK
jgi:hypothetical protein